MKKIILCLLSFLVLSKMEFQKEVEQAFLKFDANHDGLVTKQEIMDAVEEDLPNL